MKGLRALALADVQQRIRRLEHLRGLLARVGRVAESIDDADVVALEDAAMAGREAMALLADAPEILDDADRDLVVTSTAETCRLVAAAVLGTRRRRRPALDAS